MIQFSSILEKNDIFPDYDGEYISLGISPLNINGVLYLKASDIKTIWGINSSRLRLWRSGRGSASTIFLRYIRLDKRTFLYSLEDIKRLKELTSFSDEMNRSIVDTLKKHKKINQ